MTRGSRLNVTAFKEADRTVRDWRVKQMMGVANKYYDQVWSKGDLAAADAVLLPQVMYHDMVLSPGKPVVGAHAIKERVQETRDMYPDLWYNIEQLGFCDSNHLFVQWTVEATNLGNVHGQPATHRHSTWYGVDLLGFTEDRTQIAEVMVYRSLTTEEKQELQGISQTHSVVSFEDRYALSLNRLHWAPTELRLPE
jgi:hypothetical protein